MSSHPHTLHRAVRLRSGDCVSTLHTLNCSCCRMKKTTKNNNNQPNNQKLNAFVPCTRDLLVSGKRCKLRHFLPILHHLSSVILANVTVVAVVLLRNSRYNFHCYTQREANATQKSARKWQLRHFETSCSKDYKGHSLVQTSFTEPPNRSHHMLTGAPISTSPTKPTAPCADSTETIKSDGNMSKEQEKKYSSDQVWSMPHQPGTYTPIIAFRHLLKEGCRKPVLGVCLGLSLC